MRLTRLGVRSAASPASSRLAEPRITGVIRRRVRLRLILSLALLTTACIDEPPLGPGGATSAKLGLVASVAGLSADDNFSVEAVFTTPGEGGPVVLPSSPGSIQLSADVTVAPISVDLAQCPDGCPVSATLILRDDVDADTLATDTLDLGVIHQGDAVTPNDTLHLIPSYPLTIVGGGEGTGSGTVDVAATGGAAAVSCVITDGHAADAGCAARYPLHTVVTLVPAAPRGVTLEAWSGNCEGTARDARCELVMDGRRTAGVRFGLPPTTGDLEVQIAGLPESVAALVTVTGPGGFNQELSETTVLPSLPPGDYTVSAAPLTVASVGLTYTPDPASQHVAVVAGEQAVAQVAYNPPTTGTLAVTITGLPTDVPAQVAATGPGLSNPQSFPASGQASNLTPGKYMVTAASVTSSTGQPYDPTIAPAQPVAVTAGRVTTVTITYATLPAAALVFTTQPHTAASLTPITPAVTVEVRDQQNRLAPGFAGAITLSLRGGAKGATLRGPVSVIPQRGVAAFAGLTVDLAGSGYILAAAASPLPTTVSDTFSIVPGAVSPDRSTIDVANVNLRTCCDTVLVTVVARDAAGNAITGASVTMSATGEKNIVLNPSNTTDGNGIAQGRFGSRTIGTKTISATINGIAVTRRANVAVRAGVISSRQVLAGDFQADLYVMDPDGSDTVNITHSLVDEVEPVFSPDGSRIAFVLNGSIYVMNADGSDTVNVTAQLGGRASRPAWSPDNLSLAFGYDPCGECGDEIFVMNADGSNPVNFTVDSGGTRPTWSPKGDRIAYAREECGDGCVTNIWVMGRDGGGQTRLTGKLGGFNSSPAWSPDGLKIAFVHGSDLYTMNSLDGSGVVNLTNGKLDVISASWSPDGARLMVENGCDCNNNELILLDANGANPRRVGEGFDPDWR